MNYLGTLNNRQVNESILISACFNILFQTFLVVNLLLKPRNSGKTKILFILFVDDYALIDGVPFL